MIKNVNREEEKEKLFKNVWLLKPSDNKGHNLCKTINSIGNCKVEILQGLRPMLAQVCDQSWASLQYSKSFQTKILSSGI